MGFNLDITNEDLERENDRKKLLRVPVSYKADSVLQIPDLEKNFNPGEVKKSKKIAIEIVDLKKKKNKNKSKELL